MPTGPTTVLPPRLHRMNPFVANTQQFVSRMSLGQKLALTIVLIGGIGIFLGIAYWAGQPEYALLFGNLEPDDANNVVEALRADGVKYEIKNGGATIYVPRDRVYELRLRFAGEGLVSQGPVGYELFDRGTLGMTDFMQKLNLKRALEGELARTVSNIRQVEVARVHLVIPERSAFRETQAEPSASVVLKLSGSARLSTEQIDGITQLVAGAVEKLSAGDVTILDTRGNLLSNSNGGDEKARISSTQLQYQHTIEGHLTEKGQTMLDQIVGAGNAIVRVSAGVDFSRTISESNIIDPESATVIAEERMDQTGGGDAANSSIRNFELSRTTQRSESGTGQITFLTVSVILNADRTRPNEEGEPAAENYDEAELAEIESLVKNAVGFKAERGDQFAIHQTNFDTSVDERIATEIQEQHSDEQMQVYLRYGLMILALLAALWLLRSATRAIGEAGPSPIFVGGSMRPGNLSTERGGRINQLAAGDDEFDDQDVVVDDFYNSKLSPEAKARLKAKHLMFEEIKKQVSEQPEGTAELLRSWMTEDHSV